MNQLNNISQANSSNSEELAGTVDSLNMMMNELENRMQFFKI